MLEGREHRIILEFDRPLAFYGLEIVSSEAFYVFMLSTYGERCGWGEYLGLLVDLG